jgi:hypothetical protein
MEIDKFDEYLNKRYVDSIIEFNEYYIDSMTAQAIKKKGEITI